MENDPSGHIHPKKKHKGSPLITLLLIIFHVIFLVSGALLTRELNKGAENRAEYIELAEKVDVSAPAEETLPDEGDTDAQGKVFKTTDNSQRFAALVEENSDFIGWLRIEDTEKTKVDYPVMHTPDDPEYYLHRSFERKYSDYGVPFMDYACTIHSNNIYIYGHNMRNGSMFAPLHKYKEEEYWQAHPTICFDTLEYSGVYEILAVYVEKVHFTDETDAFRFYNYAGELGPEEFADYVRQAKEAAFYDTGVDAEYGDMLINLITCSYHAANGRLIVTAKRTE